MIFKKSNFITFIYLFAYKVLLDISYIFFVHKYFNYMGFNLDYNGLKYLMSWISFILVYIFIPKDSKKPSSIFLQIHLIVMIIPMFTIYAFTNNSTIFMFVILLFFIFQCFLLKLIPNLKIIRIKNSKKILYSLLLVITFVVYISMIRANGIPSFSAFNLLRAYDVRDTVVYPFLMNYLVAWQAKVINPFLITIFYLNKNKKALIVAIILQMIIYMITAHKAFLFIPLAIIIVIWLLRKLDFFKLSATTSAVGSFLLLSHFFITKSLLLSSIFLRRFLFVPAHIKFSYYDFFSNNPYMYFSLGVIGGVFGIGYPYDKNIALLIGEIYYNSPNMWTNTGYLADAYANMGYLGMLIISLLFVFVLKIIDSLSVKVGKELTVGLTIFSIISLNDGAFLTTMLTGGLLFLILILYLYSNTIEENKKI